MSAHPSHQQIDEKLVCQWINQISNPITRVNAIRELSKNRFHIHNLAPMLWHSFGTISAFLQEITNTYPAISPPTLNTTQSQRICNTLCLLQFIASHPETCTPFLNAEIPMYLLPFLSTTCTSRSFEYLRLCSLGIISCLVKTDTKESIKYLLRTEITPLCLLIMENGAQLSKIVATFILENILIDKTGLSYISDSSERFNKVTTVLAKIVIYLEANPCSRLLKRIVRCYLELSDNPRVRGALRQALPDQLRNSICLSAQCDNTTKVWMQFIMKNLSLDGGGVNPNVGSPVGALLAADSGVATGCVKVVPQQKQEPQLQDAPLQIVEVSNQPIVVFGAEHPASS